MAEIKLNHSRIALVDDRDLEQVSKFTWRVESRTDNLQYAVTSIYREGKRTSLYLHQMITGSKNIDHKNNDGLDNRRENLRPATQQQQLQNRRKTTKACSSIYKGVHWDAKNKKWRASISDKGRLKNLGRYASEVEAAEAYDKAARSLFGEFARPNFGA